MMIMYHYVSRCIFPVSQHANMRAACMMYPCTCKMEMFCFCLASVEQAVSVPSRQKICLSAITTNSNCTMLWKVLMSLDSSPIAADDLGPAS